MYMELSKIFLFFYTIRHNIASISINIPIKKNGIAAGGYFSSSDILKPPINNIIPTMAPIIDIIIFIPRLDRKSVV